MNEPATIETTRTLGIARDCNELIEIYRMRKAELNLTDAWFDDRSGLARGHIGKLLGDAQVKSLGATSIYTLNLNLALKFIVVVDEEIEKSMRPQWEERERPAVRTSREVRLGKGTMKRVTPVVLRELSRRGNEARNSKLSEEQRISIARRAGRASWKARRKLRKERQRLAAQHEQG